MLSLSTLSSQSKILVIESEKCIIQVYRCTIQIEINKLLIIQY
jgi:hypothetical protein